MSLVFNMVGGAGGSAELPAIYVTYPEGSVCTCSNGGKTYTAKDASGYWLFAGLDIGTWTVTATDPSGENDPESQTVEITREGQIVNVELSYVLWLYKNGNEYVDLTGGWQSRALALNSAFSGSSARPAIAPTLTKNNDNMVMELSKATSQQTTSGIVEIVKDVDLTALNTIKGVFKKIVSAGIFSSTYTGSIYIIAMPRTATYFTTDAKALSSIRFEAQQTLTDEEIELDVSALNGSFDIVIGLGLYNNQNKEQSITATLSEMGGYK